MVPAAEVDVDVDVDDAGVRDAFVIAFVAAVVVGSFVESEAILARSNVRTLPLESLFTWSVLRWASMCVMVPAILLPFCSCTETESPMNDFDAGAIAASSMDA